MTGAQVAAASVLLLLILTGVAGPAPLAAGLGPGAYPTTSWALGVVIPEGAALHGGGNLKWEDATNVTAEVRLPDISGPDGIVYAVMSVMADGGSVMQAAAGVYPNSSVWMAYSWYIPNIESVPLIYTWVLNASEPQMLPGASVVMSISRSAGVWEVRIVDLQTGALVEKTLPAAIGTSLKPGDQEVFALESYSRSQGSFEDMGNLTLSGVLINGDPVVSGFYVYSSWNPNKQPLFGVGSAGVSAPTFISLRSLANGSFEWGYSATGGYAGSWYPGTGGAGLLLALLIPTAAVVAVVLWKTRAARGKDRGKESDPARHGT